MAKEAFETTGLEVKAIRLSPRYFDYDFYSYFEEWEKYFQELQQLPNRCFYENTRLRAESYHFGQQRFYQPTRSLA